MNDKITIKTPQGEKREIRLYANGGDLTLVVPNATDELKRAIQALAEVMAGTEIVIENIDNKLEPVAVTEVPEAPLPEEDVPIPEEETNDAPAPVSEAPAPVSEAPKEDAAASGKYHMLFYKNGPLGDVPKTGDFRTDSSAAAKKFIAVCKEAGIRFEIDKSSWTLPSGKATNQWRYYVTTPSDRDALVAKGYEFAGEI